MSKASAELTGTSVARGTMSNRRLFKLLSEAFFTAPVTTLVAFCWMIRGMRQRAANMLLAVVARQPKHYQTYIAKREPELARNAHRSALEEEAGLIAIIVLHPEASEAAAELSRDSIRVALGSNVPIYTVGGCETDEEFHSKTPIKATIEQLARAFPRQWAIVVIAGDSINRLASAPLRAHLCAAGCASIVYWDEDSIRDGKRIEPWFKPQWDPLLHFSRDCLIGACAIRLKDAAETAEQLNSSSSVEGWLALLTYLACASTTSPIHLPFVVTHHAIPFPVVPLDARAAILRAAYKEPVALSPRPDHPEWARANFPEPAEWPGVSIIIPTRDQAKLLRACLRSLDCLAYKGPIEVILVDNDSKEPDALHVLAEATRDPRIRVLSEPGPFNFAAFINSAASLAEQPFLCLLNNDVEAIDGNWLARMVVNAVKPEIGAVGAKLLYPDGTVQHAGVVVGIGGAAGHFAKGVEPDASLYHGWFGVSRRVSAVTAACLVVRKEKFFAIGGFDSEKYPVAFNDVDLCLRLQEAGFHNVYAADATLIHHESRSRGSDLTPEKAERFAREEAALTSRWDTKRFIDPCFNPRFSNRLEQPALSLWDE